MLISREEAIRKKPIGWDVFKRSHLIYMDGVNRDVSAALLNYEAYKAFFDTILLKEASRIKDEQAKAEAFIKEGKHIAFDDFPFPQAQANFGHFAHYEYLKIGCGFELSLKSILLHEGYVLHEIQRAGLYQVLAEEQKSRPIRISELMAISSYMFDGEKNVLPGITEKSIQLSRMLEKPGYRSAYNLSPRELDIITDYKDLRNAIHLPGEIIETKVFKAMSWPDRIDHLYSHIQKHLVEKNRIISARHAVHPMLSIKEWEADVQKWKRE